MNKNRIPRDAEAKRHVWKPAKTTPWKAPGTSYQVPDGNAKSQRERESHMRPSPHTAVQPGLNLSSNSCHFLFQKMPSLIVLYSPSVYLLAVFCRSTGFSAWFWICFCLWCYHRHLELIRIWPFRQVHAKAPLGCQHWGLRLIPKEPRSRGL